MSAGYKFDASAQLDLPHADPLGAVMSYVFFARSGVVYSSINYSDIIFQASIYNVSFFIRQLCFSRSLNGDLHRLTTTNN